MKKNTPIPIGEVEYLLPPKNGKTLGEWKFRRPDTGEIIPYRVFIGTAPWAAIVLPITPNGEVIAVEQFRFAKNLYTIEAAGGTSDEEETPEEVAADELLSETGYMAEKLVPLLPESVWIDPASSYNGNLYLFLGTNCKKVSEPKPERLEIIETQLITWQEWKHMITDGRIRDLKTITITLLAEPHLLSLFDC